MATFACASPAETARTLLFCGRLAIWSQPAAEVTEWVASPRSNTKKKRVERLVRNARDESADRYHFLPGVWDIPDLVIDFQQLQHIVLADLRTCTCLGTMASPFAEALGVRFQRYIGRIGTPDLDVSTVLAKIGNLGEPLR